MPIIEDFQNLEEAIKEYIAEPTDHNADMLQRVKNSLREYGEQEVERQAHQLFKMLRT